MLHEVRRVLLQRSFFLALLLAAAGNGLLFSVLCVERLDRETTSLREAYLSEYQAGTVTEEALASQQAELEVVLSLFFYAQEQQEDAESYLLYSAEADAALREAYPELAQDFDSGRYQEEDAQCTYSALTQVLETVQTGDSYHAYVAGVLANAEQMQSVSIFGTSQAQQATIASTVEAFSPLTALDVTPGNDLPLTKITGYGLEYLIGVLVVLLLVQKLEEEKRWGMGPVLYSAAKGRLRLALRRSVLLVMGCAVLAAVLFLSTVVSAAWVYGGIDASRLVQSVPVFYDFTWVMTTGQFLLLCWGMLTLNLAGLSACLWLLRSFLRDERIAIVLFVGLVGLSALCYRVIPLISAVGWLKYVNLYAGLAWTEYGLSYYLLPFFQVSVERLPFAIGVQILFLVGMLSGGTAVHTRKRPIATPQRWTERLTQLLNRLSSGWHAQVGKLSYRGLEWYRLAIAHRGIVVAAAFVYLMIQLFPFGTAILVGKERVLDEYYQTYGGALTEETDLWLQALEETFAAADTALAEKQRQYAAGLIGLDDYQEALNHYNGFAVQREAYEEMDQQIQYLKGQEEAGYDAWLIDPTAYSDAFGWQGSSDRMASVLLLSAILWLVWTLHADRYHKNVLSLLNATADGLSRLGRLKMGQAAVCVAALYTLSMAMKLSSIQIASGFDALTAPAHSLELFASAPINPPLWVMLLLWYGLGLLPYLALMSAFCALAASPAGLAGLLLAGAGTLLPDVLTLLGYEAVQDWTSWSRANACVQGLTDGKSWLPAAGWLLFWLGTRMLTAYFWRDERVWSFAARRYRKTTGRS